MKFLSIGSEHTDGAVQDASTQIEKFIKKFESLAYLCLCELEKSHVHLKEFRTKLTLLPRTIRHEHTTFIKENLPKFLEAGNLEEIFMHLNLYWSFLDYSLLDHIIDRFCSCDLKRDMHRYKLELGKFCHETTISQVIESWSGQVEPPPTFTEFTNTLDRDAATYTLEELDKLRRDICREFSLSDFILMFRRVVKGSLIITWFVPSGVVRQLQDNVLMKAKSNSLFFQKNAIMSISISGECVSVFLPDVHEKMPTSSVVNSTYKKEYR